MRQQTLRPKPKMPSFLVDSLKKDGLYVSRSSQEYKLMSAAAKGAIANCMSPEASEAIVVPSWAKTVPEPARSDQMYQDDIIPEKSKYATKLEVFKAQLTKTHSSVSNREGQEHNDDIKLEEDLENKQSFDQRHTNPQVGTVFPTAETKTSASSEEVKLLPPTAFLLKKDGTPILNSSAILPSVFRTDSELEQGQATLQDNHHFPSFLTGSNTAALLAPGAFQRHETRAKEFQKSDVLKTTNQQLHTFVSPAEEMVQIRNVLQEFKQLKDRHRRVLEQERQLTSWLNDQPADSSDPDVIITRQELNQVQDEVKELSTQIKAQKSIVQKLTERVQQLLPSLSQNQK